MAEGAFEITARGKHRTGGMPRKIEKRELHQSAYYHSATFPIKKIPGCGAARYLLFCVKRYSLAVAVSPEGVLTDGNVEYGEPHMGARCGNEAR